jgi:prophage tail gpP-like protein
MPQTYTVQAGDRLTFIAPQFNITAAAIVQANSKLQGRPVSAEGFPTIYKGERLTIPDKVQADRLVARDPERIDSANNTEIAVLIDGVEYRNWETAEITRSFDVIADTFALTGPWDPKSEIDRQTFKPFQYKRFSLYIGGEQVMQGTVLNTNPETSANQNSIAISGYSLAGILADVMLPPTLYPFEADGLSLLQISQKMSSPFGVTVVADDPVGQPFQSQQTVESFNASGNKSDTAFADGDKIDIGPVEKIYDFLIKLARQRGLVISSDVKGQLLLQKPTEDAATQTIIGGQDPFVKSSAQYAGQQRYSSVTAIGTEIVEGAGQLSTIEDGPIQATGINRPLVIKARDTNQGNLQSAAIAQYGRQLSSATSFTVTVKGWRRPSDGELWKDNTRIAYVNPGDMIYQETEFLVRQAKYIKGPDTETTELTLVFPESYNGQIRSKFPWD